MFRLITIEREYGCGAAAIAAQLANHLGWKLWDQLLTSEIARLASVDQSAVRRCEERMDSRLHRLAKSFWRGSYERNSAALGSQMFDADCMLAMMQETMNKIGREGNAVVEVAAPEPRPVHRGIGIDLGLKDFAALSTGEKIENPRYLRRLADKLAIAQRAGKKRQTTNLCARISHARRDFHHKISMRIVREFDYIAVGNVNAAGLAKTRLAKSVLDAGWSSFRGMLRYKATAHGAWYEEVNESFSSRVCSSCAAKTGPKGIAELGIRSWVCAECGVSHDRDINSAQNILFRSGHRTPAEGIPALF